MWRSCHCGQRVRLSLVTHESLLLNLLKVLRISFTNKSSGGGFKPPTLIITRPDVIMQIIGMQNQDFACFRGRQKRKQTERHFERQYLVRLYGHGDHLCTGRDLQRLIRSFIEIGDPCRMGSPCKCDRAVHDVSGQVEQRSTAKVWYRVGKIHVVPIVTQDEQS